MTDVNPTRQYSSPTRVAAARRTRRAVLDAARSLFVGQGYARTTVDEIARAADVSRPTVFAVGSKATLLQLVRDIAMAGDDEPGPVSERPSWLAVRDAPDVRTAVARLATHVAQLAARYADVDEVLRQAAGADPELAALWETSEAQRHVGAGLAVDTLLGKGALRPGLTPEAAVDVLWLLMAPDHLARMRRRGWDEARYEGWLAEVMTAALVG